MNQFKHIILIILAIITMAITFSIPSNHMSANSSNQRVNMIAIDPNTLTYAYGQNALKSFMTLSETLKKGELFYMFMMDSPDKLYGPYVGGDLNFDSYRDDLKSIIATTTETMEFSLASSLTESYDFFSVNKVAPGSSLYLISSADIIVTDPIEQESLNIISRKFNEGEWKISGLAFEGASEETSKLFEILSSNTGSISLNVSLKDGFKSIADKIMSANSLGSLIPSSAQVLNQTEKLTSEISIPPGTNEISIMIFKEDPAGSLRLQNPNGIESSASDRTTSRVTESPHVVIWKLENPVAGKWTIDINSMTGYVSSWYQVSNNYRINLQSNKILPSNIATEFIVYVTNDGLMISPKDIYIEATIIAPSGNNVVYMLNDQGIDGDARAGDGYFSIKLPPNRSADKYSAMITLGWYSSNNTIIENISFTAQPFPTINLDSLNVSSVYINESTVVATAYVKVGEDPYPVSPSSISISAQEDLLITLNPRSPGTDGKAWMYDVYASPSQVGDKPFTLLLNITYAGIQNTPTSNLLTVSAANKSTISGSDGLNIIMMILIVLSPFIILIIAGGIYYKSQTTPFGYITDEEGNILVDFGNLERKKSDKIFHINSVKGDDTGLTEIAGIHFKFIGDQIVIKNIRVTPTVRLNNNPLIEDKKLHHNDWIGSYGKLFNFKSNT
jgi:hypothetical protein